MHEWSVYVWILLDTDYYVDDLVYLYMRILFYLYMKVPVYLYMKVPVFLGVLLFIPTITRQRLGILQRFIWVLALY